MPCQITIDSLLATPSATDPTLLQFITVTGTAVECLSGQVSVTINCSGGSVTNNADVNNVDGSWTITFVSAVNALPCVCGELVTVQAECVGDPGDPPCQAPPLNANLICEPPGGCPSLVDIVIQVSPICNADTTRNVTMSAVTTGGSIATYQWNFGDSMSIIIDANANPTAEVIHPYAAPGATTSSYLAWIIHKKR